MENQVITTATLNVLYHHARQANSIAISQVAGHDPSEPEIREWQRVQAHAQLVEQIVGQIVRKAEVGHA